jgi:LruC domain-containing protein
MGKQSNINGGVCTVCETPMTNGLAELPVITLGRQTITSASNVPGWETSASDNQIEIWSTGFNGVPAQEGNQFLEINANRTAALYQELCLEPGSTIRWSVWHRGRAGVDVAKVKIGSSLANATEQATMSDGKNAWGYYTGTYVVPTNQATTLFIFEAISTASGNNSIGNFLDNFRISCDADGDGVVDSDDDYPNDASRSYRSFFPSAGKQIVAFEDLWPSKGDYDFNDLILSNQVEISHNADNELVDAKFIVSIDAIGAGLANGIGMMLRDDNKASLAANSIQSISGDLSLDPNNPAGLILSNDVFATLSNYYQNNGFGPSQTPDTLRFTVNFNASAGSELLPELYLFRTNDRSLEVHRPGFPGTASFDASRFNTSDDNGDFKVADGLPWGIEIITSNSFNHPLEKIDIVEAFPQFANWASSGGAQNSTWYLAPESGKVFN